MAGIILQNRLILEFITKNNQTISSDDTVPFLVELEINTDEMTHLVSVGRNKILIVSHNSLAQYNRQSIELNNGIVVNMKHPGPQTQTINIYNLALEWSNEMVLNILHNYVKNVIEIKDGRSKGLPHCSNGIRHLKAEDIDPNIPRQINIKNKTVLIRFPGEPIRTKRQPKPQTKPIETNEEINPNPTPQNEQKEKTPQSYASVATPTQEDSSSEDGYQTVRPKVRRNKTPTKTTQGQNTKPEGKSPIKQIRTQSKSPEGRAKQKTKAELNQMQPTKHKYRSRSESYKRGVSSDSDNITPVNSPNQKKLKKHRKKEESDKMET